MMDDYNWQDDFFSRKVLPAIGDKMGEDCQGFFAYLAGNVPEMYQRIRAAEDTINSLWHHDAERASFRTACKVWYDLLIKAKTGFDEWKFRKKQEADLVGKQESLSLKR